MVRRRLLSTVWIAAVAAVSAAPLKLKVFLHTVGPLHDSYHFVVFSITTLLILWSLRHFASKLAGVLFLLVLCWALEIFEAVAYHNAFESHDLFIDAAGIAFAFSIVLLWMAWSAILRPSQVSMPPVAHLPVRRHAGTGVRRAARGENGRNRNR